MKLNQRRYFLPFSLNSEVIAFSFTFQMKNTGFWITVALVAIALCLEMVKGNEIFYAVSCRAQNNWTIRSRFLIV